MNEKKIILFASGGGTNAEKIMEYLVGNTKIHITKVICNNPKAGVIEIASKFGVPTQLITNEEASNAAILNSFCKNTDLIVLAGYLRKIPKEFIQQFRDKIINLHPSLLPNYGGKGMYGAHVHKAVLENKEIETGITIHYVNENFDEGRIIAQFRTQLTKEDDLQSVQQKIQFLEHNYFPVVVETVLKQD